MMKRSNYLTALLFAIPPLIGIAFLVFSMHWGPGVGGDATIYISSARNFAAGKGLGLMGPRGEFRLLPYFPPFYPLVLSLFAFLKLDVVRAAFAINLLAFAGVIGLVEYSLLRTSGSKLLTFLSGMTLAVSPVLIPVYSWAMSEPLSIFLGFAGLLVLLENFRNPQKTLLIPISALLGGLSFLTRYGAVAFPLAGGLLLLFYPPRRGWKRLFKEVGMYALVSLLPIIIWLAFDISQTATVASRSLEAETMQRLLSFFPLLGFVFQGWIIPESLMYVPPYPIILNTLLVWVVVVGVIATSGIVFWKMKKRQKSESENAVWRLGILLVLFIVIYLVTIAAVYITTYPPITIGSRMLSPVNIAVFWLVFVLLGTALKIWNKINWLKYPVFLFLTLAVGWYGFRSIRITSQNYQEGFGYLSRTWQSSETIQAVKNLSGNTFIITNETNAILFLTGREAYPIKEIFQTEPLQKFTTYGFGNLTDDESQRLFAKEGAALVLFDTIDDQMMELYGDRTNERLSKLVQGLYRAFRGNDGGIFYFQEP